VVVVGGEGLWIIHRNRCGLIGRLCWILQAVEVELSRAISWAGSGVQGQIHRQVHRLNKANNNRGDHQTGFFIAFSIFAEVKETCLPYINAKKKRGRREITSLPSSYFSQQETQAELYERHLISAVPCEQAFGVLVSHWLFILFRAGRSGLGRL
jgi:hypothetical protein